LLPPDANCPRLRPYDDTDDTIRLRNCPFDRIAAHHRQLVGGANLAMLDALTDHLGGDPPVRAALDPAPDAAASS
jgi:hypothetical protein